MRKCPRCEREFPEVEGAPAQMCPHCGHEFSSDASGGFAAPARVDPAGGAAAGLRAYRERFGELLVVWAPIAVAQVVLNLVLTAYEVSTGLPTDPGAFWGLSDADRLRYLGVALPIAVLSFGAYFVGWSLVAARISDAPRQADWRSKAVLLGGALSLVYTGGLLLIIPFFIFFHWFLFAPAAIVRSGQGPGAAMIASRRFAKERRTAGFTALVVLVAVGVALAAAVVGALVLVGARAVGVTSPFLDAVVGPVAMWPFAPLVAAIPAAYYGMAIDTPVGPMPGAGATPAERFRTTKCPGCGTLVPYEATGQPVEVVCPVCGRSGRVL